MEKSVLFCMLCIFVVVWCQWQEEDKTRKRDKRKGLSNSDLAMKGWGTEPRFLKETLQSLVEIKEVDLRQITPERGENAVEEHWEDF